MLKQRLPAILRSIIPLAVAVTLLAGLLYVSLQQVLRQDANDPQIGMAEDAAAALAVGQVLPETPPVDIAASLAAYNIIFDDQGQPVGGLARLHGALPAPPQGALLYAREHGQNRITWQPEPGVRSATVIVPVAGAHPGYVLAGRSLAEVEQRTSNMFQLITVGWLATLAAIFVTVVVVNLV